ncbi:MAG: hypothetical protein AB4372_07285 [Xenococcus sp. (in: cyanobacteria)]
MASSVAVLAFPEAADAAIVHVTDSPISVTSGTNATVDWDIDGDGNRESYLGAMFDSVNISVNAMSIRPGDNGYVVGTYSSLRNLATGYIVSAGNPFTNTALGATFFSTIIARSAQNGGFTDGVPGFIGFQFQQAGQTLFGWASIIINVGGDLTISDWAYDDSGASIAVGDTGATASTPEGDTVPALLLLGMGAAGIRQWRKNKQAKLAQDSQE